MRYRLFLVLIICISITISCKKTTDRLSTPGQYEVAVDECVSPAISGDQLKICFDEFIQESRCPENVVCVWSGCATGKFSFTKNGQVYSFLLRVPSAGDTLIAGYRINLIDILPHPHVYSHSSDFSISERKAIISITK